MRGYGYTGRSRRRPSGLVVVGALVAAVLIVGLAYLAVTALFADDEETASTTLPALTTTTSTTTIPVTTSTLATFYEVQPGDSLFAIAEQFGVLMDDIIALNGIEDPDNIPAGEVLQIPPPTVLLNSTTSSPAP